MQSLPVRPSAVRIGLALGGGFARGIAHAGLLRAFERAHIPIHCVAGVSAGAVVAAAYASGTTADEIAHVGRSMRFSDIGRWRPGRLGLVSSAAMTGFLGRLLKTDRFEDMRRRSAWSPRIWRPGSRSTFDDRQRGRCSARQLRVSGSVSARSKPGASAR